MLSLRNPIQPASQREERMFNGIERYQRAGCRQDHIEGKGGVGAVQVPVQEDLLPDVQRIADDAQKSHRFPVEAGSKSAGHRNGPVDKNADTQRRHSVEQDGPVASEAIEQQSKERKSAHPLRSEKTEIDRVGMQAGPYSCENASGGDGIHAE